MNIRFLVLQVYLTITQVKKSNKDKCDNIKMEIYEQMKGYLENIILKEQKQLIQKLKVCFKEIKQERINQKTLIKNHCAKEMINSLMQKLQLEAQQGLQDVEQDLKSYLNFCLRKQVQKNVLQTYIRSKQTQKQAIKYQNYVFDFTKYLFNDDIEKQEMIQDLQNQVTTNSDLELDKKTQEQYQSIYQEYQKQKDKEQSLELIEIMLQQNKFFEKEYSILIEKHSLNLKQLTKDYEDLLLEQNTKEVNRENNKELNNEEKQKLQQEDNKPKLEQNNTQQEIIEIQKPGASKSVQTQKSDNKTLNQIKQKEIKKDNIENNIEINKNQKIQKNEEQQVEKIVEQKVLQQDTKTIQEEPKNQQKQEEIIQAVNMEPQEQFAENKQNVNKKSSEVLQQVFDTGFALKKESLENSSTYNEKMLEKIKQDSVEQKKGFFDYGFVSALKSLGDYIYPSKKVEQKPVKEQPLQERVLLQIPSREDLLRMHRQLQRKYQTQFYLSQQKYQTTFYQRVLADEIPFRQKENETLQINFKWLKELISSQFHYL